MSDDNRRALWLTAAFILLCLSFVLLFARGASAVWDELDPEDYPPEGIAITDYDELSVVEEYKYLGMEDNEDNEDAEEPEDMKLGASSFPGPPENGNPDGLNEEAQPELLEQVKAIREDIQFFLYGFLPIVLAVFVLYKFCVWFYHTFIAGAF